jgi:hypothetical protein
MQQQKEKQRRLMKEKAPSFMNKVENVLTLILGGDIEHIQP